MRIIYGINPVAEALKAKAPDVEAIAVSDARSDKQLGELTKAARAAGVRVETRKARALDEVAGTASHQGVVAFMRSAYAYRNLDELINRWKKSGKHAFILILDSIQDPQNLGALVRSAVAAGVHGIIIPKDRAVEVTPAAVKASAGATEHAWIVRVTNITAAIAQLKQEGVWVAGLSADGAQGLFDADFKGDIAVVVGAEGAGMRRLVSEACDFRLSIPMASDFDSLNASTAGAIALFEVVRQRRGVQALK